MEHILKNWRSFFILSFWNWILVNKLVIDILIDLLSFRYLWRVLLDQLLIDIGLYRFCDFRFLDGTFLTNACLINVSPRWLFGAFSNFHWLVDVNKSWRIDWLLSFFLSQKSNRVMFFELRTFSCFEMKFVFLSWFILQTSQNFLLQTSFYFLMKTFVILKFNIDQGI